MKISRTLNQGSALLITLVTLGIVGLYMAAYLGMVSNQNLSTMRSLQWNSGIPIAEAGIEEALTHLHYNPILREGNGWTLQNGLYTKARMIGDRKFVTTISTNVSPEIISRAYVRKPFSNDYLDPPRAIRVTVTNQPFWVKGMAAKGQIDLSGNKLRIDSFDSTDPNYSTNGRYDPAKAKDNGDVATNSSLVDSLNAWNTEIHGKVSTGPGGSVSVGANGSIGSTAWHQAGNTGVEPGWSGDDMNVDFQEVDPPFTGGAFTPAGGSVSSTNYTYVLTSGNWQLSSLVMSGSDSIIVTGNAVLYVTGNVNLSGQSFIYIPANGSLKMYVAGSDASIGGKGAVNSSGNSTNFFYLGLPSNKTISMSSNASFTGSIYAPSADLTLGGGGNDSYDFVGASVTASVRMNGNFNFHYDETLNKVMNGRLAITSWKEL
jgi:hypothetical protein